MNIKNQGQTQRLKITMRSVTRSVVSVLVLTSILLQAACVSNVSSATKESNKDSTGAYDGQWIAKVQRSAGQQAMPGNWIANCSGEAWEFPIKVEDGIAYLWLDIAKTNTFVSSTGDFRFDIPLSHQAQAKPGSDKEIGLKRTSRIIYGNLKKAKGRDTFAYEEFGNNGCTAVIKFVRKDKAV